MSSIAPFHQLQSAILDHLPIGVVAATIADQHLIYANAAFLAQTGYGANEISGLTPLDLHLAIDHANVLRDFLAMAKGELHTPVYYPLVCKDGSVFNCEIQVVAADPQISGVVVATFQDITPRERAAALQQENEERLRLALSATQQGLYDLDIPSGVAKVSDEYATMIGYDPADFVETNAAWRERLHPDDVSQVYQTYVDYVAGRISEYRVEFRQKTKDGSWKMDFVAWQNYLLDRRRFTQTNARHPH